MFKRVLLTFTFVAALGAAGLGIGSKAMAWNDCNTGYAYPVPTYAAYPGYITYGPRVAYYPTAVRTYPEFYGRVSDGHHHHHDNHHHSGLSISFSF